MALIQKEKIIRLDKERNSIHSTVNCTYTSFELEGKKIFQLDTYGSSDRQHPEKISQSLQIDQEVAKMLIGLFMKELF
ncbi:hypothetical protein SY83_01675 [Paenibacillus swuensis]|uniref:Methionyl-tRNA formyltransferase n=1 Tax=Paenibacillus swuensis TaxID=1178515 RepID=A0A172TE14_9BACL|nr:hypothetical protein [Paenibacillus swuensis]ANE45250.1 hypothetical protein SY83_01675 [Paenibacillus swuensis]